MLSATHLRTKKKYPLFGQSLSSGYPNVVRHSRTLRSNLTSIDITDTDNNLMTKDTWEEIIKYGDYAQELDWCAIDKNGNLGIFSAIMLAPIPEKVKKSYDNYIRLKQIISSLPKSTSFVLTTSEQGSFSDWTSYAEKGLFAFDFQDIHRINVKNQYDLIARPVLPLNLKDIHIPINSFEALVELDCDFSSGNLKTELIK